LAGGTEDNEEILRKNDWCFCQNKTEHLTNISQKFYSLKQLDWWERSYDNQDVKVKVGKYKFERQM
jgi:hypothetical protein